MAFDLLERALFTFGRATTSLFHTKLAEGKARLDFRRFENRELWLAGYHYIKGLFKKGTYRTALEWAKLLLSLDPVGDHYCMRSMIHHLALRAFEPQFLLDFTIDNPIDVNNPLRLYTSPSSALAARQLKEGLRSRTILADAMKNIPWLFGRLFRELKLDIPKSIWGQEPRTKAEELFSQLYITQCQDLWNTPEATSLLMDVASDLSGITTTQPILSDKDISLDLVRLLYLEENTSLMALAPSALLHRKNNSDSDPLPPDNSFPSYGISSEASRNPGDDLLYHPIAALGRLIPGWQNGDVDQEELERQIDDGSMRERLEAAAAEEEAATSTPGRSWSLARTLLDMIWGRRGSHPEESGSDEVEEEEDGDEEEEDNDDSDFERWDSAGHNGARRDEA